MHSSRFDFSSLHTQQGLGFEVCEAVEEATAAETEGRVATWASMLLEGGFGRVEGVDCEAPILRIRG